MDIQTLTRFFMWCTILDGAILLVWTLASLLALDWVYRTQSRWYPIPRETFNVVMYSFLGAFKLLFLVFNVAPYVALLIIA